MSSLPYRPATNPSRIAYLSYSTAEFDSRSHRMARSAVEAGASVTIYARWEPGLAFAEERSGYRIVRVPFELRMAIPGLRATGRRRLSRMMAARTAAPGSTSEAPAATHEPGTTRPRGETRLARARGFAARSRNGEVPLSPVVNAVLDLTLAPRRWYQRLIIFPLRPMAWAVALEDAAEPADIWHGMWAGSLPALGRLRKRHGGRSVYDSRDIYLHARLFDRMAAPWRRLYRWIERRWARSADAVITVNDAYADILEEVLGVARPLVVMNCPELWVPPEPRPDLIRERLGLPASSAVVLYQGNLMTERGIEQAMDAILEVPDATLVLMGYGGGRDEYAALAARPTYAGRVQLIDPVPPDELLPWTASADILVMAIQPTTLNHRFTTPQKLFEALAVGVPMVASDLPGMARIVNATECGELCDPTSPPAIAAAIRSILARSPAERADLRARGLAAAHDIYNWESQVVVLRGLYAGLAAG
jgi:glycosyltransferase involved in cell wall biosynthesis